MTLVELIEKFKVDLEGVTAKQVMSLQRVMTHQGAKNISDVSVGGDGVVYVQANCMTIGIEPDGYAHT